MPASFLRRTIAVISLGIGAFAAVPWNATAADPNTDPVPVITGPSQAQVGSAFTLSGADSHAADAGDTIASYEWTLHNGCTTGGNAFASSVSIDVTCPNAGVASIELFVWDSHTPPGHASVSKEVTISAASVPPPAPAPDGDVDGVPDASDNCPLFPNTNQLDTDGDTIGDGCDTTPSDKRTIGTVTALSTTRVSAVMPDFRPQQVGSGAAARAGFVGIVGAQTSLEKLKLNLKFVTIPKPSSAAGTPFQRDLLAKSGDGGEILTQSPAPGTALVSDLATAQTVTFQYYDPAVDQAYKRQLAKEIAAKQAAEAKLKGCQLLYVPRNDLQRLLTAKPLPEAVRVLKSYRCGYEASFRFVTGEFDGYVYKTAPNVARNLIDLSVVLPKRPDFFLTWREDPRSLSVDVLAPVELSSGEWVLPRSALGTVKMTVQVNEVTTGRFVSGAPVEVYDETTGAVLIRTTTTRDGEVALTFPPGTLKGATKVIVNVRVAGRNGRDAEAHRSIRVVDLGQRIATICGRRLTLTTTPKGAMYKGLIADVVRCRSLSMVPGNAGTGVGPTTRRSAAIVTSTVISSLDTSSSASYLVGNHNAARIEGANTIVMAGPGVLAAGGGSVIAAPKGRLSNPAPDVAAIGCWIGPLCDLYGKIVSALQGSREANVGTVKTLLPDKDAEALKRTQEALAKAGGPVSSGKLTADGVGVIAAGGGNVIAAGGGNVIAAGGGNVIAAGGGNLVENKGLGVVAAGGGNVIAAGGGNLTPMYGGAPVVAPGGLN